ncbi:MAG: hypothetical protein DRQ48_00905 [Gammaproteobacteria bacterium]|nr:MAG: hypothetical protein DRQ44_00465 [Gammaproteobacteria bacterium]RKZ72238.1 MAG: hypothetical protein DRQ48_00905 [Gammaproteobacteria bacterium]
MTHTWKIGMRTQVEMHKLVKTYIEVCEQEDLIARKSMTSAMQNGSSDDAYSCYVRSQSIKDTTNCLIQALSKEDGQMWLEDKLNFLKDVAAMTDGTIDKPTSLKWDYE